MCHSFSDLQILVPTFDFKYSSPQGEGRGRGLLLVTSCYVSKQQPAEPSPCYRYPSVGRAVVKTSSKSQHPEARAGWRLLLLLLAAADTENV